MAYRAIKAQYTRFLSRQNLVGPVARAGRRADGIDAQCDECAGGHYKRELDRHIGVLQRRHEVVRDCRNAVALDSKEVVEHLMDPNELPERERREGEYVHLKSGA